MSDLQTQTVKPFMKLDWVNPSRVPRLFIIYIKLIGWFQSKKATNEYKQKLRNTNITKTTTQWIWVFYPWAEKRIHPRSLEGLPSDTLDGIPQHFFVETDKKDSKHYEPFSLVAIQSLIGENLYEPNYEDCKLNIRLFKGSGDVQEVKACFLSKK